MTIEPLLVVPTQDAARLERERRCIKEHGQHYEDNQGLCHHCGKVMNRDRLDPALDWHHGR